LALLAGVGFGAGVWLLLSGLAPAPVRLDRALARLGQPLPQATEAGGFDARLGRQLRRFEPVDRAVALIRADLRILGRDADEQAAEIAAFAVVGLLWAPFVAAGGRLLGLQLPVVVPAWLSVAGAAGTTVLAVRHVRTKAAEARSGFTHALSSWCEVVSMMVAAGHELHGAMFAASRLGSGPAFAEIREALDRGFLNGEQPWDSLSTLGRELGVTDLVEVASTLELAGEEGAAVADTLAGKARSIRERIIVGIERRAAGATERMAVPGAMVLIGFLWLLAYPALALILQEAQA
jgi:Flp pilus assembly protein TadB